MDLYNQLRRCFGREVLPESFLPGWSASLHNLDGGWPPWLTEAFVREQTLFLGFDAELERAFVDGLAMFQSHPVLLFVCAHAYRQWFVNRVGFDEAEWPLPSHPLHPSSQLVYAYAFLAAVPAIREEHTSRGIPERITRDTLAGLGTYVRRFRRRHGQWGFFNRGWLSNHYRGEIYRIGRLEFGFSEWHHPACAFRNSRTGDVRILAEDGLQCTEDGWLPDSAGRHDPERYWVARRSENETAFIGNPVTQNGRVLPGTISLDRREYGCCLQSGDSVLGVHLVEGEPLTPEACTESFHDASVFFRTYAPATRWRAFACKSWLLDPQFKTLLTPGSNIRQFAGAFHAVPCHGATGMGFEQFVFDHRVDDLLKAPRDTTLRRCMVEHVEHGGHWRGGAGFLLRDEAGPSPRDRCPTTEVVEVEVTV